MTKETLIVVLVVLLSAVGFVFYSSYDKEILPAHGTLPTPSVTNVDKAISKEQTEFQRYAILYGEEYDNLRKNFIPSKPPLQYKDNIWGIAFEYPSNLIATTTINYRRFVYVVPQKIYDISRHIYEVHLPAVMITFEEGVTTKILLSQKDKEYYGSPTESVQHRYLTSIKVKTVHGFDRSPFYHEFYEIPKGVIIATYRDEDFSKNFISILDSIRVQ